MKGASQKFHKSELAAGEKEHIGRNFWREGTKGLAASKAPGNLEKPNGSFE
jgi:hypothetical protein